ncbi:MAG: hypothetical protein ABIP94_00645, partial [Planctomycetota bacterium]
FGCTTVDLHAHAPADGDTLWLERDVTLRVHVIDVEGTAQPSVPLAMGWARLQNGREVRRQRAAAITGADGFATIAHAQLAPEAWSQTTTSAWVTFAWPGFAGPGVAVDLTTPPSQPIDLILPGLGRIVVEVDPALADGEASVLLISLDEQGERTDVSEYCMHEVPASGRVEFDRARTGRRFRASLRSGLVWAQQDFAGPTRAGEGVVVRLEAPVQLVLHGRAMLDDLPLARQRLRYEVNLRDDGERQRARGMQGTTWSDAEGRFAMRFDRQVGGRAVVYFTVVRVEDLGDVEQAVAHVQLEQLPAIGDRDLGDVVLQVPPVLVDGVVVFEDGTPCLDVHVAVDIREPDMSVVAMVAQWALLRASSVDEHFAVRGAFSGSVLRLVLQSPQAVTDAPLSVPVPSHGLRLMVARAGSLAARVRTVGDFEPRSIGVFLRSPSGERLAAVDERETLERTVQHWFGGLRPGSYDVCCALAGQPRTELRVPGVIVRKGEQTRDPRLLDIEFAARKVKVLLLDASSGEPIGGHGVVIFDRPETARWSGVELMRGGEIVVQGEPEGIVYAPDHEPVPVRFDRDVVEVRLPSNTVAITVALAAPPTAVPAGQQLRLHLEPVLTADELQHPDTPGGGARMADFLGRVPRTVDVPWVGSVVVTPPRGRYRLHLELRSAIGSATVEMLEPAELDLQVPGSVTLQVSTEACERAAAALR